MVSPDLPESVLAEVLTLEDEADIPRLWDGATSFDAAVEKFQGHVEEQRRLRRSNAYCEIQLGHLLGPNPVAGPGRGKKHSARNVFIPAPVVSKLRRQYGYRDQLLELVRTDDEMCYRERRLQWVSRQEANRRLREAREQAQASALPPDVLALDVADARDLPLEDEVVDLIVTSPPYGLDVPYPDGDVPAAEWPHFMGDWLREAWRVTKPSGRLALNVPLDTSEPTWRATYAESVVAAVLAGWAYRSTVVWHDGKTTKGGWGLGSQASAARPHHVSQVEMIGLFSKGEWGPSSDNPDDITRAQFKEAGRGPWTFTGESKAWDGHPAPFPLELPRRLIRYLCRVGDIVLDPFVGSGTTLVAALELKRAAMGFDISEVYVESARTRLGKRGP